MTELRGSEAVLRAIIADDEPLAREALRDLLQLCGGVEIVADADDLPSLEDVLRRTTADVVFLDIAMPGGSALDAVSRLQPETAVVFATAYPEHAARAFALDAGDYLVKPFGQERVAAALRKVRRRLADVTVAAPTRAAETIFVRVGGKLIPVVVADIWRIEGADDCVRIVGAQRSWLHSATLDALARQLDAQAFIRVHRRHIINLRRITRIVRYDGRRAAVVFPDRSVVVCSRTGTRALRRRARVDP